MVKFKQKGGSRLDIRDLEEIENFYNIKLPEDYKINMLEYNGISPINEVYYKPSVWDDEIELFYMLPIKNGSSTVETNNVLNDLSSYPEKHLIIGRTKTGGISMSFKEKEIGGIYVFYSDGEIHKIAGSYTEFLEGLTEEYL
ncbi:SMI1/KNR4 family protein [uncultured Tenacibaculum sp.]|uniref:SMI1/KNR4 family protein n=1 Tax=uncultured Tenacibaculum sp. TaxID=174713 RepID=UPI0026096348|nr:SMI1/KNR4 family protein [uncultured Tenacibaculum sp.]